MPVSAANPFKGRQYPGDVILTAVRWYLRYPLAYEHVSELLAERGLAVDASCVWRWVQAYAAELNKVKGQEKYLYRAVDSTGQTIDFLLTARRDAAAAKRFFQKVFRSSGNPIPRVITLRPSSADNARATTHRVFVIQTMPLRVLDLDVRL